MNYPTTDLENSKHGANPTRGMWRESAKLSDLSFRRGFFMSKNTEAKEIFGLLSSFGSLEEQETSDGVQLCVLPSCSVPKHFLNPANWRQTTQMGNSRDVRSVDCLKDGTKPGIVVKSPERVFTSDRNSLRVGEVWWGGERSGQTKLCLPNHPVVEEQALWEAIILSQLRRNGIRAEVPQALIKYPNGRRALVVGEISGRCGSDPSGNGFAQRIQYKTGLIPVDSATHNYMSDKEGVVVIDVNRWLWPPQTDSYRQRLVDAVSLA